RWPQLVVLQTSRYVYRTAGSTAQHLAGLEVDLDPAVQHVNELVVADMIVPAGRLAHAGFRLSQLGPHLAAAGVLDRQVAIGEEIAPALDHHRVLGGRMAELHRRLAERRDIICHRTLLVAAIRSGHASS